MKRRSRNIPLLVLSSSAIATSVVGYGSWILYKSDASENVKSLDKTDETPVCFIGDTYYTTVEKALEVSSSNKTADTIYIIPGKRPTLSVNAKTHADTFELASEDTLVIAFYSDETNKTIYTDNAKASQMNVASLNLKNSLTIGAGVTFNVNGTLTISGMLSAGSGGQAFAGNTGGDYSKLILESGYTENPGTSEEKIIKSATINCNGTINCYGYIENESSSNDDNSDYPTLNMKEGSSLYLPFVVRDFRGGSSSTAIYKEASSKSCFLFNQYEICNVSTTTHLLHGSKLFGWCNLYSSNYQNTTIDLAGPDGNYLFQTTGSDSRIVYKHVPDTSANNGNPLKGKSEVSFVGGAIFNSLQMTLLGNDIDTSTYYFPLNKFFSFKFVKKETSDETEKTSFSIPHKTKIMTGCNFEIGEDCDVNIGDMIIYNYFKDDSQEKFSSDKKAVGGTPYPLLDPAVFLNKGTINATNLAGCIVNNDGKISVSGKKSLTSYEAWKQSGSSFLTSVDQWTAIKLTYSEFEKTQTIKPNNHVLIYTKNIENPNDISFTYNGSSGSLSLDGYYTDYVDSNAQISISGGSNIDSISINGSEYTQGNKYSVTGPTKIEIIPTASSSSGGGGDPCLLPTSKILMADGSYKNASDVHIGDMVMSFNHENGNLEPNKIIGNAHEGEPASTYNVVSLLFSNGNRTSFVYEHGYFDLTLNKYVYLHEDDTEMFVGHEFVYFDGITRFYQKTKLVNFEVKEVYTKLTSPATADHLNIVSDNMLSMAGGFTGLFNIFEYYPNSLMFNKELMQRDIDKYGLLDYEYFKEYFPKEVYDLLPCKYMGVSIGKGLITWKTIELYISKWKGLLLGNV